MTLFIKLTDVSVADKPKALREALSERDERTFIVDPSSFKSIPGTPFAYWASPSVRSIFASFEPLENEERRVRQGLATAGDERFLRKWTEIPETNASTRWVPFAKGGSYSPIYSDLDLVIEWECDGKMLKAKTIQENGNTGKRIYNEEFYRRPGITWPRRTNGLSFRFLPSGSIFSDKGPSIFVEGDSPQGLCALCAIANSQAFGYLVSVQLARTELAQSFEVGLIQQTPMPDLPGDIGANLARLASRAWSVKRCFDTQNETSHSFLLPPGLNASTSEPNRSKLEAELAGILREINEAAYALYDISCTDRAVIEGGHNDVEDSNRKQLGPTYEEDEDGDGAGSGLATDAVKSWLVGVAFGRFDPRLATGERPFPREPQPFEALPICSPGMWPSGDRSMPQVDILIDDEGQNDDLITCLRAIAERVHVDVREGLHEWVAKEFFPLHIRMYSKSRRKAPIYWQLATPSASFSVWLYIHGFTKDTLYRVQNDYVSPKLARESRALEALMEETGDGGTSAQRKALATQDSFVGELRAFLVEVRRVAPLWNPDLDDGVMINFAPLWRLVPQHRAWQKELRATWNDLCESKYDWAHLAMHLWPERVVPKCASDRSLAIAHSLEDVFWVEDDGNWKPRQEPTRPVNDLVTERSSDAVKAALKSLIEAPDLTGPAKRGRKSARA